MTFTGTNKKNINVENMYLRGKCFISRLEFKKKIIKELYPLLY